MSQPEVAKSIESAKSNLLSRQMADGSFPGKVYFNVYATAMALLLYRLFDQENPERENDGISWILERQNEDGSWGLVEGGEGAMSTTYSAVLALENLGRVGNEALTKGKEWIKKHRDPELGDIDKCDPLLKIFGSLLGKLQWNRVGPIPIETSLIPGFIRNRFIKLPAWCVPTEAIGFIVANHQKETSILRRLAMRVARRKILKTQYPNGSWFNEFYFTAAHLLALRELGYGFADRRAEKAFHFLESLQEWKKGEYFLQRRFDQPIWDTLISILSLMEADSTLTNPHQILKAGEYLLKSQLERGGWGLQPDTGLPDVDDTAFAIYVLSKIRYPDRVPENERKKAVERAVNWLKDMQNEDGGFPTYAKNQSRYSPECAPAIYEDPSTPDVTAHVVWALSALSKDQHKRPIQSAVDWIVKNQREDGSWYGRWMICYIYGTSQVLYHLGDAGIFLKNPIEKAVNWLLSCQNEDGGWGETYAACRDASYAGKGTSTPEQTSWAIMGLLHSNEFDAIRKGVSFLLRKQSSEGRWESYPTFMAVGPCKNEIYSIAYPLWALSLFQKLLRK